MSAWLMKKRCVLLCLTEDTALTAPLRLLEEEARSGIGDTGVFKSDVCKIKMSVDIFYSYHSIEKCPL